MMQKLLARWRKPAIISVTGFTEFLERNAWLVTQKSVVGYSVVKTKLPVHEMLKEKPFADAYSIAIWDSYPAVLADLTEVALNYLRATDPARGPLWASRLGDFYESLVNSHPVPPHRISGDWSADVSALRLRLRAVLDAPGRQIREISLQSAERLFAKLPFHERLREPDAPAVIANVQFLMVGLAHEFERIDYRAVAADILASRVIPANESAA